MNRRLVWLTYAVGALIGGRLLPGTPVSLISIVCAIMGAGIALALHWGLNRQRNKI